MATTAAHIQAQEIPQEIPQEILFIDSQVPAVSQLLAGVKPGIAVILLDSAKDGLEQITATLAQYPSTTLHLVSHGSPGCLYLGDTQLNLDTLHRYSRELQQWHISNLLLYGCNVAAGDAGEEFIQRLSNLTGAKVAASKTLTGSTALNGDWNLEVTTGHIDLSLAFTSHAMSNYEGVLSLTPSFTKLFTNDVVVSNTTYTEDAPSVAVLSGGGFVVTWDSRSGQDGSGYGVYGQIFNADGSKNGAAFGVNTYTTNGQYAPSVAALGDGGFVVTWTSNGQDGSGEGIYGQRFNADATKNGNEFQVNTYTTSWQANPAVTGLSDGRFIVTWNSNGPTHDWQANGRIYKADGTADGEPFLISTFSAHHHDPIKPSVTALSNGGFIVAFSSDGQYHPLSGSYGNVYNSSGAMISQIQVQGYNNFNPSVTALSNGGFVFTWRSWGRDGYGHEIPRNGVYGQLYAASGNKIGSEFLVNSYIKGDQHRASVTALDDGGFVVTWTSAESWDATGQDGSGDGIYAKIFNADGSQRYMSPEDNIDSNGKGMYEFRVNTTTGGFQNQSSVAGLNDGGFVVTWQSAGDIHMQIYKQPLPTLSLSATTNAAEPTTNGLFTLTLSTAAAEEITVNYTISGTATNGTDYTTLPDTIVIPAGQTTATIPVNVIDDSIDENTESITIQLQADPNKYTLSDGQQTINLTDNDDNTAPTDITLTATSINENVPANTVIGTLSTTDIDAGDTFTYSLSGTDAAAFTINGSELQIKASPDFETKSSYSINVTTTDAGGLTHTKPFTISVNDLSEVILPTISLSSTTNAAEPTTNGAFTLTLSTAAAENITVNYTVSGTATNGTDYTTLPGSITIPAGQTTATIPVNVIEDSIYEPTETITIQLQADPSKYTLSGGQQTINLTDNDTPGIILQSSNTTTREIGTSINFSVLLNGAPSQPVTIAITGLDSTEGRLSTNSLTFNSSNWDKAQTVIVTGVNDQIDDDNQTYTLTLTSSGDSNFAGLTRTIDITNLDDNDTAGITVNTTTGTTTEAGGSTEFVFTLTSEPTQNVTINFPSHPEAQALSPLTFTSGNWNQPQTLTVTGADDSTQDGDQTYTLTPTVTTSDVKYQNVNRPTLTITNKDNDAAGITVNTTTGTTTETGGTTEFEFRVNTQPTSNITINFANVDSTEGTISTNSLTFTTTNWNTPQTLTVTGVNDDLVDSDITYSITTTVSTSDSTYNTIPVPDLTITNTNDDFYSYSVTTATTSIDEGNSGSKPLTFTVTRTNTSGVSSVGYVIAGNATISSDYNNIRVGGVTSGVEGVINFSAGETSKAITLDLLGDTRIEAHETIVLKLRNPSLTSPESVISTDTASITITNDDLPLMGNDLTGTNGNDLLRGTANPDTIRGMGGNDRLLGFAGNDTLTGGPGADLLDGGDGGDIFVYQNLTDSLLNSEDRLISFSQPQGDRFRADFGKPLGLFNAGIINTTSIADAVNAAYTDANKFTPGAQGLGINSAVFFGWRGRQYLSINDGTAGFQSNNDLVLYVDRFTFAAGPLNVDSYFTS